MKKVSIALVLTAVVCRLLCCGRSVDLTSEIRDLGQQQAALTTDITKLLQVYSDSVSYLKAVGKQNNLSVHSIALTR